MAFSGFGSSGFGSTNTNTFGSPATSGFGSNSNTGGFGTNTNNNSGSLFGSSTTPSGGFGSTNNNNMGGFGSMNSGGFGSTTANNTGGGFGTTGGGFGSNNNSNTFGASTTGGFGSTNTTGGFGANNNTGGGFGSTNTGGGFNSGGFGSTNTGGFGASTGAANIQNQNTKDIQVVDFKDSPTDTISSLVFGPNDLLLAASWDNSVRVYEVPNQNGRPTGCTAKAMIQHAGPVLDCCFKHDGTGSFSVGADGTVKWWQFGQAQGQDIGKHNGPVRSCRWIPEMNALATASFDKTLKYWDCRQPNPVMTVNLPERAYCMDVGHPMLVVGCGSTAPRLQDRQVLVYNLSNLQTPAAVYSKAKDNFPLKHQTRCVTVFKDRNGFACGSVEGRVAIRHVGNNIPQTKNFAFKCHRERLSKTNAKNGPCNVFAVNAISVHPVFGTFSTAGADGKYHIWDKDQKQMVCGSERVMYSATDPAPITATTFSQSGMMFGYAVGYDWSKGRDKFNNNMKPAIYVHQVVESDVKPRPK